MKIFWNSKFLNYFDISRPLFGALVYCLKMVLLIKTTHFCEIQLIIIEVYVLQIRRNPILCRLLYQFQWINIIKLTLYVRGWFIIVLLNCNVRFGWLIIVFLISIFLVWFEAINANFRYHLSEIIGFPVAAIILYYQ